MRRVCLPVAAGLAALVVAVAWSGGSGRARPAAAAGTAAAPRQLGVGSCAAAACHHGNGPAGSKGSEYSTWVAVDPHARAFQTLFKPESRAMHETLARAFPEQFAGIKGAEHNPLCLDCHGAGGHEPERIQADGAGCERCHGPAEKWVSTHYLDGFDRRTPGFIDLRNDRVARAQVCMKCHVGDAGQEVDHVLIAAGHPRLRYESGAYYANYAGSYRHWADLGEKERDPAFEARNWVLGQLLCARAALELLLARAADPRRQANWPEFAEYDCTACHHDLTNPSRRQLRSLQLAGRRRAGELVWGTWYYPLLPALARNVAGAPPGLLPALAELDRLMRLRYPPPGRVAVQARRCIDHLDLWLPGVLREKFSNDRLAAFLRDLAGEAGVVESGWDGGSQVYLGLAALHQARGDVSPRFRKTSRLRQPLAEIRTGLRRSFPPAGRPLYDTPDDYPQRLEGIFRGLAAIRRTD